jgi:hypothetical protein
MKTNTTIKTEVKAQEQSEQFTAPTAPEFHKYIILLWQGREQVTLIPFQMRHADVFAYMQGQCPELEAVRAGLFIVVPSTARTNCPARPRPGPKRRFAGCWVVLAGGPPRDWLPEPGTQPSPLDCLPRSRFAGWWVVLNRPPPNNAARQSDPHPIRGRFYAWTSPERVGPRKLVSHCCFHLSSPAIVASFVEGTIVRVVFLA